jgi:UTP--glucose-1-phosphate uridylyltransferase
MKLLDCLKNYFNIEKDFVRNQLESIIKRFEVAININENPDTIYSKAIDVLPSYFEKLNRKTDNDYIKLSFLSMFLRYFSGDSGKIAWENIEPLNKSDLIDIASLTSDDNDIGIANAKKVAILKLNGGLGTSMGCTGPKSAIAIDGEDSFLEVIAKQVLAQRQKYDADFPFILMNSFNTNLETKEILKSKIDYIEFNQNEFPKIDAKTDSPFSFPTDNKKEWNPPGHGDIYLSLFCSGELDRLIENGYRYVFISNSDNLGPIFDPRILGYMIRNNMQFLIETTPKTKQDVKGGTIIRMANHLHLLERAQVEDVYLSEFEDIHKFKVFNTNNIWIDLLALKQVFETNLIELPIIVNPKKVENHPVIQLECAMGAAISTFGRACSIVVDRDRFLPVKKTSDLLILQSDFVLKDDKGTFALNPERRVKAYPEIILSSHFDSVSDYQQRIKAMPSLQQVEKLEINGDITLGNNVIFKGIVQIFVEEGYSLHIENEKLENINISVDAKGIEKRYTILRK